MDESFGARLRRERERRHISLQDIAERTKVKASLFDALERDDTSRWPSGLFRRAFIRGYADAVGLDADATVREFAQLHPDPDTPTPPAPPALPGRGTPDGSGGETAGTSATTNDAATHGLRLTLVDARLPFTGGRNLVDVRQRWAAAAWDCGSIFGLAVAVFVWLDAFWVPFGITALFYYVGGVLVLGNSPGVCLFAPRLPAVPSGEAPASRVTRPRHQEATIRAAEAPFRTHRVRGSRNRHIHG